VQLLLRHPVPADQPLVYSDSEAYTGARVRAAVTDLSALLVDAGVQPGSVVADLAGGGVHPLVVMYATWLAEAVYMPCSSRLTDDEIRPMIQETPPALLVGPAARLDALGGESTRMTDEGQLTWSVGPRGTDPRRTYDRDVALVMRTSGTTGRAKSVLLRHSGTLAALDTVLSRFRSNSAPNSTPRMALWAGIYNTLFAFRAGATLVLLGQFSTAGLVGAVRRFDIKSTVLAPAMITMLNDDERVTDLQPLRFVRSITAPLRKEEAERFYSRFGIPVLNSYGQTELGGEVVGWTAADVRDFGSTKLGAVGRPHGGIDLQIRNGHGEVVGVDQPGEVWVRSPFLMRGYADGADSPDERLSAEGYLRTGDLGHIDPDGFLWIQGRQTDMINRGGLKVSPEEVEEALVAHPHVSDACVAGIPDARLGQVPHAWVVAAGNFDPDALEAWCRQRLAPYKVPVGFSAIDRIPRSEIGKVLRRALVDDLRPSEP
jgi:acyl-CoA synthetase (AMP-forming)/AMP-acid ligase II